MLGTGPLHPFTTTIERPGAVLFACFKNAVRSPMAEAILKYLHGTTIYVDSCGVREGDLDPMAVEVLQEIDISLARHRPKTFDDMEDHFFDLIISLSPEAHHRAAEMTWTMACDIEYWPTLDATIIEGSREMRLAAYRQVRDDLTRRIKAKFSMINVEIGLP